MAPKSGNKKSDLELMRDMADYAMRRGNPHPLQGRGADGRPETPAMLVERMMWREMTAREPDEARWIRDARMGLQSVMHMHDRPDVIERAYAKAKEALGEPAYPA